MQNVRQRIEAVVSGPVWKCDVRFIQHMHETRLAPAWRDIGKIIRSSTADAEEWRQFDEVARMLVNVQKRFVANRPIRLSVDGPEVFFCFQRTFVHDLKAMIIKQLARFDDSWAPQAKS